MMPEAPTMKYKYGNQEEEFVFCHKGRPFAILMSPHLPTPSSTFIDHLLVKELGIKMTEIQCKKLSYCGKKLRILGKVSCTIQCVNEGNFIGNFFLKASVVEDLKQHFDTHGIDGNKMAALLQGDRVESIDLIVLHQVLLHPTGSGSHPTAPHLQGISFRILPLVTSHQLRSPRPGQSLLHRPDDRRQDSRPVPAIRSCYLRLVPTRRNSEICSMMPT